MTTLLVIGLVSGLVLLYIGLYLLLRLLEAACPPFARWVAEWDDEPGPGRPF